MHTGLDIEYFLEKNIKIPLIDVRSPSEFLKGHIPGARNVPLFDDSERKKVGICYKEKGRDSAVRLGLDIVGPKMGEIVDQCLHIAVGKQILVYCWRGGMRSQKVSWLLDTAGFEKVYFLNKGYKAYRSYARDLFEKPWDLKVIGGFTGSGKTNILQLFKAQGTQVLDLEEMAQHKGSAFGSILGSNQTSVEHFENLLAIKLRAFKVNEAIVLEDESRNIGSIKIPDEFFKKMRLARVYFLDIPKEKRAQNLSHDYGNIDDLFIISRIKFLNRKLGGVNAIQAIEEVQKKNYTQAAEIILNYYDKSYLRGLSRRSQNRVITIQSDTCDAIINFEILKKKFADKIPMRT
jgi:tRNA 2-selenouridine synthase